MEKKMCDGKETQCVVEKESYNSVISKSSDEEFCYDGNVASRSSENMCDSYQIFEYLNLYTTKSQKHLRNISIIACNNSHNNEITVNCEHGSGYLASNITRDKLAKLPEVSKSCQYEPEFIDCHQIKQEPVDEEEFDEDEDNPEVSKDDYNGWILNSKHSKSSQFDQHTVMDLSQNIPSIGHQIKTEKNVINQGQINSMHTGMKNTGAVTTSTCNSNLCMQFDSYKDNAPPNVKPCALSSDQLPMNTEQEEPHVCINCDQIFNNKSALDKHLSQIHKVKKVISSRKRIFKCPKCKSRFAQQASLVFHMKHCQFWLQQTVKSYRNSKNVLIHQCAICNHEFKTLYRLYDHIRCGHTNDRFFQCDICSKSFISNAELCQHTLTHHKEQRFSCVICNAKFTMKHNLVKHITHIHSTESAVRCELCLKTYKCKAILNNHIKNVHGFEKFECHSCAAVFKCKKYLQHHINTVHSDNSFKCSKCNYASQNKGTVNRHMKSVHPEGPPVPCTDCDKCFNSRRNMLQHKHRVHHGARH